MVLTRRRSNFPTYPQEDYASDDDSANIFFFDGKAFASYEEMVDAKRKRNQQKLESFGLLEASHRLRESVVKRLNIKDRGLSSLKQKRKMNVSLPSRKSSRLAGVKAAEFFIESEGAGGKVITSGADGVKFFEDGNEDILPTKESYFKQRVNDGSILSLQDAIEVCDKKWIKDDSASCAKKTIQSLVDICHKKNNAKKSSTSKKMLGAQNLFSAFKSLKSDDETNVAKVVPDRIYSVTFHPTSDKILAVAGDKQGYVGLWDTSKSGSDHHTNGVSLFRPHGRPVASLEWNRGGDRLLSASYDGSVRLFDIHKQEFSEIFATYDDSDEFKNKLGYDLDEGRNFWIQHACIDHVNGDDDCLFISTSAGTVLHVDLRMKKKITFNKYLSEKKINTVSLHPNGQTMVTAGLDRMVQIWDIRKFQTDKRQNSNGKVSKPLSIQHVTKSVNSAFFSPSGRNLLCTTMANTIDIIKDAHLQTSVIKEPTFRIRHDNQTGRWLSTFMAKWHPAFEEEDIFVVGSMIQPRTMEFFDGNKGKLIRGVQGDALTAVVSRCCFHPSTKDIIAMGGNSSGRVTLVR